MIKKIRRNWFLQDKKSFMIGDKISDQKCANKSELYFEFPANNILKQIKLLTQ